MVAALCGTAHSQSDSSIADGSSGKCGRNRGSVVIKKVISNKTYALSVLNNSLLENASIVWTPYNANNIQSSQRWYTESVCYKRGDVDMDGNITTSDGSTVLTIAASIGAGNSSSYNNSVLFLADFDRSGSIDAVDTALIYSNLTQ